MKFLTKPDPEYFAIGAMREPETALAKPKPIALSAEVVDPAFLAVRNNHGSLIAEYQTAASSFLKLGVAGKVAGQIFVTSPRPGEGKTSTAFNLAWTLADSGKTVLLVELNFLHPRMRDALGNLRPRFGLEGTLRGTAQPEDAVLSFESNPRLFLAPIRNVTPIDRLAPLLERLDDFLRWAGKAYDLVVIDCPSVLSEDWAGWFSEIVGPSLLVVRHGVTPQADVQKAIRLLGSNLKCALLNRVPQSLAPAGRMGKVREMPPRRQSLSLHETEEEESAKEEVPLQFTN